MYSIINPTTTNTLFTSADLSWTKHIFNHIPRRKNSPLYLVDGSTGEILKIKPKK